MTRVVSALFGASVPTGQVSRAAIGGRGSRAGGEHVAAHRMCNSGDSRGEAPFNMELVLVRHGRTEWNAAHRFQGRTDVPLSDEGEGQARAIAAALAGETFDSIYSSDLKRALQTARAIARGRDVEVRLDHRLREFDFGAWEGLTWAQIVKRFPQTSTVGHTSAVQYAPQGGETFAKVRTRVRGFLNELLSGRQTRVVVVTHAGVLHAVVAELFGDDIEESGLRFTPGSITRVAFAERRPHLVALNDVGHLA